MQDLRSKPYEQACCAIRMYATVSQGPPTDSLSLVYDSGAQLEQIAKEQLLDIYNSQGTAAGFDTRSDNKGK
jgi:propanediol dehydratase small subunit